MNQSQPTPESSTSWTTMTGPVAIIRGLHVTGPVAVVRAEDIEDKESVSA